jgi:hypothetical protein
VRELQVLGVSDDGDAVLLGSAADSGKPSHRIPVDERLRAAVRGQLSAVSNDRAEIALAPKEIQARLRAGDTPEQVAKAAQVPVARVLPYAAPVEAERLRIVEQARAALLHRQRGPNGQRPLGDVVDGHLNEVAGLRPDTVEWTARRRPDGAWVVLLAYAARGGRRSASWLWRPAERDLTTLDLSAKRLATEETEPVRRRPAAAKAKVAVKARVAVKAKPKPARAAAAKPAAKAKPAATAKPAAARSTAATAAKAARKPVPQPRREPRPEPAAIPPAVARRPGARVPVPSWSDVLLGVASAPRDTAARQATPARQAASGRRRRKG